MNAWSSPRCSGAVPTLNPTLPESTRAQSRPGAAATASAPGTQRRSPARLTGAWRRCPKPNPHRCSIRSVQCLKKPTGAARSSQLRACRCGATRGNGMGNSAGKWGLGRECGQPSSTEPLPTRTAPAPRSPRQHGPECSIGASTPEPTTCSRPIAGPGPPCCTLRTPQTAPRPRRSRQGPHAAFLSRRVLRPRPGAMPLCPPTSGTRSGSLRCPDSPHEAFLPRPAGSEPPPPGTARGGSSGRPPEQGGGRGDGGSPAIPNGARPDPALRRTHPALAEGRRPAGRGRCRRGAPWGRHRAPAVGSGW